MTCKCSNHLFQWCTPENKPIILPTRSIIMIFIRFYSNHITSLFINGSLPRKHLLHRSTASYMPNIHASFVKRGFNNLIRSISFYIKTCSRNLYFYIFGKYLKRRFLIFSNIKISFPFQCYLSMIFRKLLRIS